jgi:hypothetical protein
MDIGDIIYSYFWLILGIVLLPITILFSFRRNIVVNNNRIIYNISKIWSDSIEWRNIKIIEKAIYNKKQNSFQLIIWGKTQRNRRRIYIVHEYGFSQDQINEIFMIIKNQLIKYPNIKVETTYTNSKK